MLIELRADNGWGGVGRCVEVFRMRWLSAFVRTRVPFALALDRSPFQRSPIAFMDVGRCVHMDVFKGPCYELTYILLLSC